MYAIKQIDPTDWQSVSTLAQFYADLATNPYCTNDKGFSHIRTKSHAIKHAYIQPNHPEIIKWLVFDIDDPQALFAYHDKGLPRPQIIIKNPENGHAHYAYKLTTPVGNWRKSSHKAMRYLASVQKALRLALGADKSYGGNLVKNPCHTSHEVYLTGAKSSYTLAELAENLDLELYQAQEPANDEGYGRNYSVFQHVRPHGYALASAPYSEIVRQLQPIAEQYNQRFDVPLFPNELKHIVRSIARYCTRKDFTASHKAFSELQRARVTKRWGDSKNKQKQALEMYQNGVKKTVISKQLGVTTKTLTRWGLRKIKK
ncbi:replication initiation protein [Psychrobacter faecalis]|uniref:replication initiation protein n=1 Tax=Psychrobacter faecalis TaxID=180588 RepID=UPI0019188039|nr:replication initiation protein [Psychrobacter faecalis]